MKYANARVMAKHTHGIGVCVRVLLALSLRQLYTRCVCCGPVDIARRPCVFVIILKWAVCLFKHNIHLCYYQYDY